MQLIMTFHIEHLAKRPGRSKKTVSEEEYDALKQ